MKVRTRSRLILVATIILFLLALSYVTQSVILASFKNIEQQEMTANMQRALAKLNDDVEQVASNCRDWAEWDDSYTFVDDLNSGYIHSNLAQPTSFKNLGINYMLFYNSSGALVYAKGYDTETGGELEIPAELDTTVRESILPEGFTEGISGRRGFSILNGKPVIIVGYQITTTDLKAPPRGTLVMVRLYDSQRTDSLERQTLLAVNLQPIRGSADSGIINPADLRKMENGAIITRPFNDSIMAGSAVITGIENSPTMILVNVTMSRPIYQQVQASIFIVAMAIIVISILFFLAVQLLLQRFILAPLSTLDSGMKKIGESGNLSYRIPEKGDEEIVSLTRSLNTMLDEIQHQRDELNSARQALSERNKNLEELNRKSNLYLDIYLDAITYEILNAIMGLRGYAQFLKDTTTDKEQLFAEKIIGLTVKSGDVIRNIETISRIYKTPPEIREVDLMAILNKEIESRPGVRVRIGDCTKMVLANDMLGVVFDNLFSNSIKFGGNNVEISVNCRDLGDGLLEVSVADNGPGISDSMKPLVFDRFAKDSRTRSSYGLGLHIVKMLIEGYGGKVWAEDRLGGHPEQGAAIRFTLRKAHR